MPSCVFCGASIEGASREHVIPQWARRCFRVSGPLAVHVSGPGESDTLEHVAKLQHLNVTLDEAICRPCNNGHLSRLERDVQPILSPMMVSAERVTLDVSAQTLLARWAVKTVFLLERAARHMFRDLRRVAGYVATDQEFAWLKAECEPPPRSMVWVGCWDCRRTTPVRFQPAGAPLPTSDGRPVTGHFTTFSLGFVAFQVFTVDFVTADLRGAAAWNSHAPSSLQASLARIWPQPRDALVWPQRPLAHDEWDRLVTWDGVLETPTAGERG